ncbi:hypothetical protein [Sporosarcina gallistercoris]|uniref:Uncharacterized protein n=1 Tax=Sporosarcina gallistercoris TaxID=2762245 RepID=A0ABR8PMK9_9BACL|nr:hypothetical protein [Sporosarcina gallistercoris]MBD7909406.1 hypothetical protein [Sporosarcina gallistercoris]
MNKKLKIFFLVSIVVILAGVSYILYEFKFKTYEVADDKVDEIIDEPYKLELPDGTPIEQPDSEGGDKTGTADGISGANGSTSNAGATTETSGKITVSKNLGVTSSNGQSTSNAGKGQSGETTSSNQAGQNNSSTGNSSSKPQTGGDVSVASIKAKYQPTLASLENQAAGRLSSLVGRAKSEYEEKSKTGDVNYGYFYNKYMGAAKSMEAQTDGAFNSVMKALENELHANGYDKSYAKNFRSDYEARKKNLRTELMNKAMGR